VIPASCKTITFKTFQPFFTQEIFVIGGQRNEKGQVVVHVHGSILN